ncbi:MAG: hypothetical protein GWP66_03620 [Gammaproteobacteria bacterium]|jgi:hypothetical protein|nr:hypothetical protein [Gammaproteobacteria bacterium]
MLLTETILTVILGLVAISLLIDWAVLRIRAIRLNRSPGVQLDAATAARIEQLAARLGGSGQPRSSEEVLGEALDDLSEKYGSSPGPD